MVLGYEILFLLITFYKKIKKNDIISYMLASFDDSMMLLKEGGNIRRHKRFGDTL